MNNNSILLVAELKGHLSRIIGHGFLSGRQLISCDREGVVNVWDWKLSQPIS